MQIFNTSQATNAALVFINNEGAKNELITSAIKYAVVRTLLDGDTSLFNAMLTTLKTNKALKVVKGKEKESAPFNDGQNYYDYASNRKGDIYRALHAVNTKAFEQRTADFKGFKKSDFSAELIAQIEAYADELSNGFITTLETIALEKKAIKASKEAPADLSDSAPVDNVNSGNAPESTPFEVEHVTMEMPQGIELSTRNGAFIGLTVNGVFLSLQALQDAAAAIQVDDVKATKEKAKKTA